MTNPYRNLPNENFWSRSVAKMQPVEVDPVSSVPFTIDKFDKIATAGSCFAQHIARTLSKNGFGYLVTEPGAIEENYGLFPARFGNVYTTRQMLQLFQRAYGLFHPTDDAWNGSNGAWVDPFRPQIEKDGFTSIEALRADRVKSLAATRAMFEQADVFIFTLGLTESWRSKHDGAVVPLAPGVAGTPADPADYEFHNADVFSMIEDMRSLISNMRVINPEMRVILTVSPVPLIATYEKQHVLPATIYSKSALRVVAETISKEIRDVAYFPSYEIITGHHAGYGYFDTDLRSVLPDGVAQVMGIFSRHYLSENRPHDIKGSPPLAKKQNAEVVLANLDHIVCDEEAIEASL
ncbi:GSCFA domain-containing protein [Sphingobium sp. AS12]|uniref:GSCFA domain-containing protein n=1 Tax=Sphingobium sp. AS12 TaxID=2849495 RepID=UPI001C31C720|nr:GSCFA domain-containing protein [Sphingobium sp. AS12]MBV2149267.1 GSCFA domain-containing protein [Sphingobium sp. AS12]